MNLYSYIYPDALFYLAGALLFFAIKAVLGAYGEKGKSKLIFRIAGLGAVIGVFVFYSVASQWFPDLYVTGALGISFVTRAMERIGTAAILAVAFSIPGFAYYYR